MIVARTEKGHGVSEIADHEGWHGKALPPEMAERAIAELGGIRSLTITPPKPEPWMPAGPGSPLGAPAPVYTEPVATRKAFGETVAWLAGERDGVVVLDGEVGNSTYTEDVEAVAPQRFFQMYIAEQTLVGTQTGLQALGKTAFAATFGAFLTRAYDQIRMAAIGRADLRLCGSHAGVSIGEDGPSQMALEDLAALRAIHGTTVLYPADGNATVAARHLDGRSPRHLVPPHDEGGHAVALRAGGGLPDRRVQDPPAGRRRRAHRGGHHGPRVPRVRPTCWRATASRLASSTATA